MRRLTLLAAAIAWSLCAACQRTPPEEIARSAATEKAAAPASAPPPSAQASADRNPIAAEATSGADAFPDAAGRCVKLTPTDSPPPVPQGPALGCPVDPEPKLPSLPRVRVTFPDAPPASVDAELVRSPHDTARGLMYRKAMAEDHGMLFDLQSRDDHRFWMHNTCIPLDLLFIDEDGLLVGIVENAPTLDDASRSVGCPSQWVLEVNAGWARRHGVRAGSHVSLPRG